MIFYLSPWMSANERERELEGKGERVPEKRGSGLGGVIKARQVGQTYAWLPGKCVTCNSQQVTCSGPNQTNSRKNAGRIPERTQAGVQSKHFSPGLHPNMLKVRGRKGVVSPMTAG